MVAAVFLPVSEPTSTLATIEQNTLIQQEGWSFIVFAVLAVISAYRSYRSGRRPWAPIVWGLLAVAYAIYMGTDKGLRTLYPVGPNGTPDTSGAGTVAAVGIAVYLAGASGLVMALGGRLMRQSPLSGAQATARCPDCAETILAAARVCKHCGAHLTAPTLSGDAL